MLPRGGAPSSLARSMDTPAWSVGPVSSTSRPSMLFSPPEGPAYRLVQPTIVATWLSGSAMGGRSVGRSFHDEAMTGLVTSDQVDWVSSMRTGTRSSPGSGSPPLGTMAAWPLYAVMKEFWFSPVDTG